MNKIRKILQKTGFDFHRYRSSPDRSRLWRSLGIRTVLDIGANVGQFSKEIRRLLPEAKIYSFEPLKECFDKLNSLMLNDKNFKSFNFALGDKNEGIVMNKSAYSPSSSILEMSEVHKSLFPHTKEHIAERIMVKKLDEVAKDLNLDKEILIKVDVQGFEDRVIKGGEKTFREAKAVIIEVSFAELYSDQPSFDDLYQKLRELDFEYCGSLEQKIDSHTASIISEDSLFILNNFKDL
jgi:FkbM family methyltransferase